jgi:putative tryptophan/tyrosine transport system substrate-binding protein
MNRRAFFAVATDPVAVGLVVSLARPGHNATGATSLGSEIGPKKLELLHELLPTATNFALLTNPTNSAMEERALPAIHDTGNSQRPVA